MLTKPCLGGAGPVFSPCRSVSLSFFQSSTRVFHRRTKAETPSWVGAGAILVVVRATASPDRCHFRSGDTGVAEPRENEGRFKRMSSSYARVSTTDDQDDDDDAARIAASPASANGKALLKPGEEPQTFKEMVKEDFWSNFNFLCCGGYKQELQQLRQERDTFGNSVRRRNPSSDPCDRPTCSSARSSLA